MRGAYEVGVVAGIAEVMQGSALDGPLFDVFAGTSVGAINAAYFAANADESGHGAERLAKLWQSLRLSDHARVRPFGLWSGGLKRKLEQLASGGQHTGTSLLDTRALEVVIKRAVQWERMHRNIASGRVHALMVAALHVASGRTTVFGEHAPGVQLQPARDERRVTVTGRITADHVLASAAIPLLFAMRKVGDHYYCDGGLRFNTPIAPAIRAGAERLVVISVRHQQSAGELDAREALDHGGGQDLGPLFLVGKLLNALLLDPVAYDLQMMERLNQMMEVLEEALPPDQLERVQKVWIKHRGAPYRRLDTLVFTPSEDLGRKAGHYIRNKLDTSELQTLARFFLERAASESDVPAGEADWASYMLFDGGFARELIELGRRDAHAKANLVRSFFGAR